MEYWEGLIFEWTNSREIRVLFCKRKRVTVTTFPCWKTKLGKLESENGNTTVLARCSISTFPNPDQVILVRPQGIHLQIPQDIQPAHLSNTLHNLSDEEKNCGCGAVPSKIDEEIREELAIIPEQILVKRHIYPR